MKPMPHSSGAAGLPGLLLAAALALPAGAAPDPVLVPPLPTLAPVTPRDLAQDLAPLRDATTPPPPAAEPGDPGGPAARPETPAADGAVIQTASFRVPGNATAAAEALTRAGLPAVVEGPLAGGLHRVLVGPVPQEALRATLAELARAGYADAFVLTKPPRRALSR